MKMLIVGSNSNLGGVLKNVLADHIEVVAAGRNKCDWIHDVNDYEDKITYPDNTDVVIQCAASFGGESDKAIYDAEYINVLGMLKLSQAAIRQGVKHFVYISSIFPQSLRHLKENNIYSISRRHAEEIGSLSFFIR
jgi:dTDP-4-dehydrorhamnose reductase